MVEKRIYFGYLPSQKYLPYLGTLGIWGIKSICRNPQIQQQLEAELHASIPNMDKGIAFAEVKNLIYLVSKQ